MTNKDDTVRFNVQMPRHLREDAKRKTERGELAEETRDLFRRLAYGHDGTKQNPEVDRVKAELRDARDHLDTLRSKRRRIEADIEDEESRITRLEERLDNLQASEEKFENAVETLEQVLLNGGRIFPERIDDDLNAGAVIQELKERNPEIPDYAFEVAGKGPEDPADWREVGQ